MKQKLPNSGFTLVELLVVIAIIGILAAIVIANLMTVGTKATDASAKETLSSARTEAALWYSQYGTYTGMCSPLLDPYYSARSVYWSATVLPVGASKLDQMLDSVAKKNGLFPQTTWNNVILCEIYPPDEYIIIFPIQTTIAPGASPTEYFCVDATGFAGIVPVSAFGWIGGVHSCPHP